MWVGNDIGAAMCVFLLVIIVHVIVTDIKYVSVIDIVTVRIIVIAIVVASSLAFFAVGT